jgi:sugar phosphate permease
VWGLIIAGIVVLAAFVVWQKVGKGEPLLPLALFRDRNFSLANASITAVGFAITSMSLPLVFYFQTVRGLTPTQSALMLVPMAVISAGLAPVVGKLIDRVNPRNLAVVGMVLLAVALTWYSLLLKPDTELWMLLFPSAVLGLANAGIWAPISNTATRNLPPTSAGAGSGVYNTTRQIGAVLGSASIAVLIESRLAAELPAGASGAGSGAAEIGGGVLPDFLQAGFATAMGQALLLPAAVALVGAVVVAFFAKPTPRGGWAPAEVRTEQPAAAPAS